MKLLKISLIVDNDDLQNGILTEGNTATSFSCGERVKDAKTLSISSTLGNSNRNADQCITLK